MSKSNAEMPSRDVRSILALVQSVVDREVATAQSDLARQVIESMSTMAGGNHGGGLIVVSREAAVERLRDLFTRLQIDIT